MAYRRRHYSGYDINWKEYQETQRARISAKYGGIDKEVRVAFFDLPPSTLSEFFHAYKSKYGASAASYARKTYLTWKSGEIEPSGQTSERLLEILPGFLTFQTKCGLLQKLREHYRTAESYQLTLSILRWREVIIPLVHRLIHKAYAAKLPENVHSGLSWLTSGSMQVATALLAEAEVGAARASIAYLEAEFGNIDRMLVSLPGRKIIKHSISLPYGTINITFNRSMKMNNDHGTHDSGPEEDKPTGLAKQTAGGLLETALGHLGKEELRSLSETAARKALDIKEQQVRAELRHDNATRQIDHLVETATRLERSQMSNIKASTDVEGAAGRTHIEVSKQGSTVTIVVAVVIGIVLLILFASRH